MRIEIISRKTNPLLGRDEVEFKVFDFRITPTIKEVRAKIAEVMEKKPEFIVVDTVEQEYGTQECNGIARAYKDKERLMKMELPHVLAKNFEEEKQKIKQKREQKKAEREKKKMEKGKKKKK